MTTTTARPTTAHRARLRRMVQTLVIEHGYLERMQSHDADLICAETRLDEAIDILNEYLAS